MIPWGRIILILVLFLGYYLIWGAGNKEGFDDPKMASCDYINTQRDWFQDKIYTVRTIAQDMSGAIYTTMNIKTENIGFQYDNWEGNALLTTRLGGKCTAYNTSPECIMLATPDSNINRYADLTGTNLLELARLKLLTLDTTLTQELAKLNDSADVIGCPRSYIASQQKTFSTTRDVGYLATNTLRNSLQQLSPYYIDASMLAVLMSYLITDPKFLSRVNTVPANTGYINDDLDALFMIMMPGGAGNSDLNKITPTQATQNSLRNYTINTVRNNFTCAINGDYAQLSNAAGWVVGS